MPRPTSPVSCRTRHIAAALGLLVTAIAPLALIRAEEPPADLVDELVLKAADQFTTSTDPTFSRWLSALVGAGRTSAALDAARGRWHPGSRCWGLAAVARAMVEAGEREDAGAVAVSALAAGRLSTVPERRTRAVARAAAALHLAGREKERDAALLEVESGLGSVDNIFTRAQIAGDLADAGRFELARKILSEDEASVGNHRDSVLRVFRALVRDRRFSEARATAERLAVRPRDRSDALLLLSRALFDAGHPRTARETQDAALRREDGSWRAGNDLVLTATILSETGRGQLALELISAAAEAARAAGDPFLGGLLNVQVAEAFWKLGRADEARAAAERLAPSSAGRSAAESAVVAALARQGRIREARERAARLAGGSDAAHHHRQTAYLRIAAELGRQGRADDARGVIQDIGGPSYRESACREAAIGLVAAKRYVTAVELADACTRGGARLEAYRVVLRALTRGT